MKKEILTLMCVLGMTTAYAQTSIDDCIVPDAAFLGKVNVTKIMKAPIASEFTVIKEKAKALSKETGNKEDMKDAEQLEALYKSLGVDEYSFESIVVSMKVSPDAFAGDFSNSEFLWAFKLSKPMNSLVVKTIAEKLLEKAGVSKKDYSLELGKCSDYPAMKFMCDDLLEPLTLAFLDGGKMLLLSNEKYVQAAINRINGKTSVPVNSFLASEKSDAFLAFRKMPEMDSWFGNAGAEIEEIAHRLKGIALAADFAEDISVSFKLCFGSAEEAQGFKSQIWDTQLKPMADIYIPMMKDQNAGKYPLFDTFSAKVAGNAFVFGIKLSKADLNDGYQQIEGLVRDKQVQKQWKEEELKRANEQPKQNQEGPAKNAPEEILQE